MRAFTTSVLLFCCAICMAQTSFVQREIVLWDSTESLPVMFANVALKGSMRGFVSDEYGQVKCYFTQEEIAGDSIEISCIGYRSQSLRVGEIKSGDTIAMSAFAQALGEVIVRPMPANEYLKAAVKSIAKNYFPHEYYSRCYYKEFIREGDHFINHLEAVFYAHNPSFYGPKGADTFQLFLEEGRVREDLEQLEFMFRERKRNYDKTLKKAKRQGENMSSTFGDMMDYEYGEPASILRFDPLRHQEAYIQFNNDKIQILDTNHQDEYDFWYGTPVSYGDGSLVVIHFDQRPEVKKPMLAGTMWIEPESKAFVRMQLSLSPHGEDHLLPFTTKAALFLMGISFELGKTELTYDYRQMNGRWVISTVKAFMELDIEKRRLFSANERALFEVNLDMVVMDVSAEKPEAMTSDLKRISNSKSLIGQFDELNPAFWRDFRVEMRHAMD